MVTRTVCFLQPSHSAYWALTRRVAECVEQRDTCQRLETALSQRSCFASLAFRDELVISVNKRAFCVFEVASQDQSGAHSACSGTTTPRRVLISKPCNEDRASSIACKPSYSFRSGRICYYPPDLSDRLWLKVSRPRREGSVQAESLCIQLISWLLLSHLCYSPTVEPSSLELHNRYVVLQIMSLYLDPAYCRTHPTILLSRFL